MENGSRNQSCSIGKKMKDIVCLIPTWLTATHALNAYKSFHRYYPDIPVFFVTDRWTQESEDQWRQLHPSGWDSLDIDYKKLEGLPNSTIIWKDHEDVETNAHGKAVSYAMQFIYSKWVIHLSDDVRIVKEGVVEYLMEGNNNKTCGIGDDFSRNWGPNVGKWLCMFRGDLYHKYDLNFNADREKCLDAGAIMFQTLIKKGYPLDSSKNTSDYIRHLFSHRTESWDGYYEIK